VGDLEALKAVAALSLAADDIEDLVDELGTLSVMTLGPVVASTGLTEDEVVGTEELTEGTSTNGVHGTGLKIDEDGAGDVLVARGLQMSARFGIGFGQHTSLK
jgi:proteasome assembly chaperone (PAC2) family protein